VAVPDAEFDYSALQEAALINRGLPFLRLVYRSRHWRVYAVQNPSPIVQGAATLTALGPNSLALQAPHTGMALVRVRYSPYWAVTQGSGCVSPAGDFIRLVVRRPGTIHLGMQFSLGRIGATSARCT
jgi:hypothetical protein